MRSASTRRRAPILQQAWDDTSWRISRLRDEPASADAEHEAIAADDPGMPTHLVFGLDDDIAAPFIATGIRPRLAIVREQGVNSQSEMAYAFAKAGFECVDVHMSDLAESRRTLADFVGFVACGGFSYGDVLGAGEGWAKAIRFDARLADMFSAFFARANTFALGVCNGCQMMASLAPLIPGADAWPRFTDNRSRYEARLSSVIVEKSPSLFFDGMEGTIAPIAVAHGEGRADFARQGDAARIVVPLRFVDHAGRATERYPLNPNGSADGLAGITTPDGRFTALMPHPETRVPRSADVVASGRLDRREPVDADLPQRAAARGVTAQRAVSCRICDPNETSALLPFDRLFDAIDRAAVEKAAGRIACPERLVVPLADGATMLSMPAVADDLAIHKLITVAPRNAARGLATIQGAMTIFDPHTGASLMVLDGPTVTGRRTAAVSMSALHRLGRSHADSILLIGTGAQASHHLHALAATRPGCRLRVRGTSRDRADAFCDAHRGQIADLAPACDSDDSAVVITCTTSSTPVWHGGGERLVIAVGAYRPSMAEVAPEVVRGSAVWVDDPDGARHEAGDLIQASVDWSVVASLADLVREPVATPDHRPRLFKSVGCAAWDLAAARVAMQSTGDRQRAP